MDARGQYTLTELLGMKAKRLQEIANGRGLELRFNKSHNIETRAKRIMAAEHRREMDSLAASAKTTPAGEALKDASPAFEKKCDTLGTVSTVDGDAPIANVAPQAPDSRGGVRPGAGRPLGTTDAVAAMRRLPEVPHPFVQDAIEFLFDSWADMAKCPQVALTKDEAVDLALPWTQCLEFVGVTQRIPVWLGPVMAAVWNTKNIVKIKAQAIQSKRAKDKATDGQSDGHTTDIRTAAVG